MIDSIIPFLLTACFAGILLAFITIIRTTKKFSGLDKAVQSKLGLISGYMTAVRNLPERELIQLGQLSEEEIGEINTLENYDDQLQAMRKKLSRMTTGIC
jgi:hypothetical protein